MSYEEDTLVLRYPWILGLLGVRNPGFTVPLNLRNPGFMVLWYSWISGLFGFCWRPWFFGGSPSLPLLLQVEEGSILRGTGGAGRIRRGLGCLLRVVWLFGYLLSHMTRW